MPPVLPRQSIIDHIDLIWLGSEERKSGPATNESHTPESHTPEIVGRGAYPASSERSEGTCLQPASDPGGLWSPWLQFLPSAPNPDRGWLGQALRDVCVHVRLFALSDVHLSNPINREALDTVPSLREDWLILADDVVDGLRQLDWCFHALTRKFKQLVWVPGNHELWTRPGRRDEPRGVELYEKLVEVARRHGVITPKDPYPVCTHPSGMVLLVPLFLLCDYSFRPSSVRIDEVVAWAERENSVCSDEYLLHSDPFPDRGPWCAASCAQTAARLEPCLPDIPKMLINHLPLEEKPAVQPKAPRFTPSCVT